jgi:putative transposase
MTRLNQNRSIADVLRVVKTNSSKWSYETFPLASGIWWQNGYGEFTVGLSNIEQVKAYIAHLEEHHRGATFQEEFRGLLDEHGIEYNEKDLWD